VDADAEGAAEWGVNVDHSRDRLKGLCRARLPLPIQSLKRQNHPFRNFHHLPTLMYTLTNRTPSRPPPSKQTLHPSIQPASLPYPSLPYLKPSQTQTLPASARARAKNSARYHPSPPSPLSQPIPTQPKRIPNGKEPFQEPPLPYRCGTPRKGNRLYLVPRTSHLAPRTSHLAPLLCAPTARLRVRVILPHIFACL